MSGGLDLHEEVAAAVRDADGAWQFLRRFTDHHATPIVAGDGCTDDELRAAQARLGLPLPASLRDLYALIGRRDDLTRNQDQLLTPEQLHVDDTGHVLVFRVENQAVTQWGIPVSTLTEPDPPVVFQWKPAGSQSRAAGPVWRPFLDRVSLAGVEMVLSEWMLAGDIADNRDLDDELPTVLEGNFRRLPIPDYPLWAEPDGRPMRWFSASDALLRDDGGIWLWVRAGTPAALAAVVQALPGEWLMHES